MGQHIGDGANALPESSPERLSLWCLKSIELPTESDFVVGCSQGSLVIDGLLVPLTFRISLFKWTPHSQRSRVCVFALGKSNIQQTTNPNLYLYYGLVVEHEDTAEDEESTIYDTESNTTRDNVSKNDDVKDDNTKDDDAGNDHAEDDNCQQDENSAIHHQDNHQEDIQSREKNTEFSEELYYPLDGGWHMDGRNELIESFISKDLFFIFARGERGMNYGSFSGLVLEKIREEGDEVYKREHGKSEDPRDSGNHEKGEKTRRRMGGLIFKALEDLEG